MNNRTCSGLMVNVHHTHVTTKGFKTSWEYAKTIEDEHYVYHCKKCLGLTNTGRDLIRESTWVLLNTETAYV